MSDAAAVDVLGSYAGVTNCRLLLDGLSPAVRLYYSAEGCLFIYVKGFGLSTSDYQWEPAPFYADTVERGSGGRGPDLIIGGIPVALPRKHANRIFELRQQFTSSPLSLLGLLYAGEPLPLVDQMTTPDDGDRGPRAETWAVFPDGDSGRLTIGESHLRFTSAQSGRTLVSALNEISRVHAEPSAGVGQARLTIFLTAGRAMGVAVSKAFAQLIVRRLGDWRSFWLAHPSDVVALGSPLPLRESLFSDLLVRYKRQQDHIYQIASRVDLATVNKLLKGTTLYVRGFGVIEERSAMRPAIDVAAKYAIAQASIGWFEGGAHPAVAVHLSALERAVAEKLETDVTDPVASDLVWNGFSTLLDTLA